MRPFTLFGRVGPLAALALLFPAAPSLLAQRNPPAGGAPAACPWVRSTAPVRARVAQVVSAMTQEEKLRMVHGSSGSIYVGFVPPIPRLCVPALKLEDGPAGVADGLTGVTQLPAPVALAASWDTALAREYGAAVGAEEGGKGANVDLGPTVNIVRDPRWGRAFEAYGEDPWLTGRMGVAYIRGVQGTGVLAQVKHWLAYNQETNRNTPADSVLVDRRTLHEIYMPAFEAAIKEADASSVMCSYNMIGPDFGCEYGYAQDTVLKGRWRFRGFITSDWGATHSTVPSANHGLDLEMPDSAYFGAPLKAAVQAGQVSAARLDDMVGRLLTSYFRFGLFDRKPMGDSSAVVTTPARAALARRVAEEGTVLLKNSDDLLPLSPGKYHAIAVIGPSAGPNALTAGGGSAAVVAPHVVTPFQGIAKRAGEGVTVRFAPGAAPPNSPLPPVPSQALTPPSGSGHGLSATFYNNMTLAGPGVATRVDTAVAFDFRDQSPAPGVNANEWSAKWTGTITPPVSGEYTFALTSDDGSRLFVNGQQVIDNWRDQAANTESAKVTLTAGQPVQIEIDFYQNHGGDMLSFGWQPPAATSLLADAVALAKASDLALVFVSDFQTEGADLADIDLPGGQNELIRAVAAANPNTIVVLNTGSAVTMPWIESVKGVIEAWYPGQEDGDAIARILFGDVNPAARLPVTFPKRLADAPASTPEQWPGVRGRVQYSEGLQVGYRWYDARKIEPLFPFGFGLSYTTFRLAHLQVGRSAGGTVSVRADVTNTGRRAGAEVVQLYVGFPAASGEPPRQLKAFRKVRLAPGETRQVQFQLGRRAFAHWDGAMDGWVVDAGDYTIALGDSSAHLPLTARVRPMPGRAD